MENIISVDIQAQFGFLKKPDINEGIYLTYNILHKPALLGILGAVAGLEGYRVEGVMKPSDIPVFRKKLANIKVAIQPLNSHNGNFPKDVIKYTNTVGYASEEQGGVLIVNEQTLIKPSYRVYLLWNSKDDLHQLLADRLKNREAEYIPYLGKNDHQLWWDYYQEWQIIERNFNPSQKFKIDSIFSKPSDNIRLKREERREVGSYMYFERLPKGWHSELPHYNLDEFLLTNFYLEPGNQIRSLLKIRNEQNAEVVIQIF